MRHFRGMAFALAILVWAHVLLVSAVFSADTTDSSIGRVTTQDCGVLVDSQSKCVGTIGGNRTWAEDKCNPPPPITCKPCKDCPPPPRPILDCEKCPGNVPSAKTVDVPPAKKVDVPQYIVGWPVPKALNELAIRGLPGVLDGDARAEPEQLIVKELDWVKKPNQVEIGTKITLKVDVKPRPVLYLKGDSVVNALFRLANAGFKIKFLNRGRGLPERGIVVAQEPDTTARRTSLLLESITIGADVPSVVGNKIEPAIRDLQNRGLDVRVKGSWAANTLVAYQSLPPSQTELPATIELTPGADIPSTVGDKIETAMRVLLDQGLDVKVIGSWTADTPVAHQSLPPGLTELPASIELTPVPVPAEPSNSSPPASSVPAAAAGPALGVALPPLISTRRRRARNGKQSGGDSEEPPDDLKPTPDSPLGLERVNKRSAIEVRPVLDLAGTFTEIE